VIAAGLFFSRAEAGRKKQSVEDRVWRIEKAFI